MINFKKGNGLTLQQSDIVGKTVDGEAIVSGMVCRVHTDGTIKKGVSGSPLDNLIGFAVNNQDDGDVISSGKLGLFLVANNAVVETDQTAATINVSNYPIGKRLSAGADGLLKGAVDGEYVIGHVTGVRSLPGGLKTVNQDLTSAGDAAGPAHRVQSFINVVSVKLEGYLWKTS